MHVLADEVKNKIEKLEYSFAKKIIFLLLVKQFITLLFDLYFWGTKHLFYDLILLLTVGPCYIFTLVSGDYNFQKVGKLTLAYLMLLNTFLTIVYYQNFPSIIVYVFIFPIALLLFYNVKKTVYISAILLTGLPLSIIFNYYFIKDNININDILYYEVSNTYMIVWAFIIFTVCLYYAIQILRLKSVYIFLMENNISVEGFFLLEKQKKMRLFKNKYSEDELSITIYEKLFKKIELLMQTEKPWKNPEYSLKQLARDVNSNTQYVSTTINNYTKNNFKTYLNEFRLNAFIASLEDKNEEFSMEEIYLTIGFYNRSTFNRVFKSKFKMTPQEYINSKEILICNDA
ncbi:helix-turn-helix domain-containing protein [Chryseobacterium sp. PTM-20240506]|uniref:helix-turn-helix domain-containing protein n=4 Tax=Chryseobacterium TaxID=59732 RepID=UPI002359292D|nr:helix-turn-helix domain-containing protein [Chryseobacterium sp. B21-037]MDC8104347.1 AraC family transcriptional regulator [Chryseobacterium sp. B21-037]